MTATEILLPDAGPGTIGGLSVDRVKQLFNPKSIALIGATDKSFWSLSIYKNLLEGGFDGAIYLVNPRGIVVHGQQSYATLDDLPETPDLAFVMVSTAVVLEVMGKVADAGVPTAVVLTSGFGEVGEEGAKLETELIRLAQDRGITVLGPNGNGYVNNAASITPYGLPITTPLRKGNIGVVLQSGALASAVIQLAQTRNAGVSLLVSMGNESMVSMTDVMRYLVEDEATKVIVLFIESIRHPEDFLEVAHQALLAGKPIVALKVGRSEGGARVAKAHTGSLVGDDGVIEAVFRQNAVIRVDSLEDLMVTAELLSHTDPFSGRRIGFVTPSGGACEVISDRAEDEGIEIPSFAEATEDKLREVLPDFASVHNPIDVTGYILIDPDLAVKALKAVEDDPNIDEIVYVADLPHDESDLEVAVARAQHQAEAIASVRKPVIVVSNTITDITPFGRKVALASGFPGVVGGIHHGMTALGRAAEWGERYHAAVAAEVETAEVGEPIVVDAKPGDVFAERQASALLAEHGVPVVPNVLVRTADDAVAVAEEVGYPVVVKLAADEIEHKSDIGGVKLNLRDAESVRQAFVDVTEAGHGAGAADPAALVQPQRSGGIELIVGAVRDPKWGMVLAVGLGGVWVEVLKDSTLHLLPVNREQIRAGLTSLRGAALLDGARGTQAADLDAVTDAVLNIAQVVQRLGTGLESLEVNPLLVRGSEVEALDALITWR
ncbi:CoA-binding protein [Planctomonas sp. JC2975]|uniref:acetate--CoA ligase family protein n=1 Tax=Planctomonas sp. JC2975 TaxID=2729626 RepID=UPI0014743275|nr:acetate--CoA ligase [Planctomonas sp. JC2975]NNC12061.1 CoA-binding protein [Planctomonas sp. JC2975]